jgi:hypothetical protein
MLIELKQKTVKIYGDVYYYVSVDGEMISGTWTTDKEKALESFLEIKVKCIAYPCDRIEVIKSETI